MNLLRKNAVFSFIDRRTNLEVHIVLLGAYTVPADAQASQRIPLWRRGESEIQRLICQQNNVSDSEIYNNCIQLNIDFREI